MIGPWYDPLTQRWIYPKEKPQESINEPEAKSSRITQEIQRIWNCVVDVSKI